MQAFLGDKKLKAGLVREVKKHRLADQIISGTYGEFEDIRFKGCAVGCSLHSYGLLKGKVINTSDHSVYEEFGIPRILAKLQDMIFEGLPEKEQQMWPEQFWKAIPNGADLTTVWPKFAIWLLIDAEHGVIKYASRPDTRSAIQRVAELYQNNGTKEQFREAAYAAYAADAAAAYAAYADAAAYAYAADAAAAYAAYADAAAYAADAAAAYAAYTYTNTTAYAAAYALRIRARSEARHKAYIAQSKKLLEIMAEAKP